MNNIQFALRHARTEEAGMLTELCLRSKAMWGYCEWYMKECRKHFRITEKAIGQRRVLVNTPIGSTIPVGVSVFQPNNTGSAELDYFFVDPDWMGRGVGSHLYRHTCLVNRAQHRRRLYFCADRHAFPFYEKMGAKCIGFQKSETSIHPPTPQFEHLLH